MGNLYPRQVLGKSAGHSIHTLFNPDWLNGPHWADAGWHRECGGEFKQRGPTRQWVRAVSGEGELGRGPHPALGHQASSVDEVMSSHLKDESELVRHKIG